MGEWIPDNQSGWIPDKQETSGWIPDMPSESLWDKVKNTISNIGINEQQSAQQGNQGVAETAASLGSGLVSWIPAGLRFVGGQLNREDLPAGEKPETLEQSSKAALDLQSKFTYEPKTEVGKALTEFVNTPLAAVSNKFEEGALYSENKYKEALANGEQESADRWNAMIGASRFGRDSWMFALPLVFKAVKGLKNITKEATSLKSLEGVIPEPEIKSAFSDMPSEKQGAPASVIPDNQSGWIPDIPSAKPYSDQLNSDVNILDTKIEQIKVADVSPASKEIAIKSLEKRKQGLIDNAVKQGKQPTPPPEIVQPVATSGFERTKIKIEPSEGGAAPIRATGEGWESDRGAMPGEPFAVYKDKVAITERQLKDNPEMSTFEVTDNEGNIVGNYGTIEEASRNGKIYADGMKPGTTSEGKQGIVVNNMTIDIEKVPENKLKPLVDTIYKTYKKYEHLDEVDPGGTLFKDTSKENQVKIIKDFVEANTEDVGLLYDTFKDFMPKKEGLKDYPDLANPAESVKLSPVTEKPGTANIPAKETPVAEAELTQEAKKYKSAEEFAQAKRQEFIDEQKMEPQSEDSVDRWYQAKQRQKIMGIGAERADELPNLNEIPKSKISGFETTKDGKIVLYRGIPKDVETRVLRYGDFLTSKKAGAEFYGKAEKFEINPQDIKYISEDSLIYAGGEKPADPKTFSLTDIWNKAQEKTSWDKPKEVTTVFNDMVKSERDALDNVLYNWKEARLNEDGTKLTAHIGREGERVGTNEFNKKYTPSKKEFLEWLNSDEPFNTKIYGEGIKTDKEWASDIQKLRNKAQQLPNPTHPPEVGGQLKSRGLSAEMQNANETLQLMRDIRKNGKINTKNLDSAFGKDATDQLKKMGLASDNGKIWYDILAQEHNLDANEMMQSLLDYKKTSITKAKEVQYLKEKYNAELKAAKIDPGEIEASSGDLRASLEAKGYSPEDIETAFKELAGERAAIQGDVQTAIPVIDEETYLTQHGASRQDIGESALHKNIPEGNIRKRLVENQAAKDRVLVEKRDQLRKEYNQQVKAGEIRPPTRNEKLIGTANGHPDNASVQAARRILEKNGIEWNKTPKGDVQPNLEGLSPEETFTLNNPTTEISKPLSKQATPKNSSLFSDINTLMGGERGSISSKGLSPEQLAAKERLDVAFEKFKEEAKKAGKEFGEYIKEVGLNEKAIAYFNSRNKEQGIGSIEKPTKLAQSLDQASIDKGVTNVPEQNLSTYLEETGMMESEFNAGKAIHNQDPALAYKMAMGDVPQPEGMRKGTMWKTVSRLLLESGDIDGLYKLKTESKVPKTLAVEAGREVKSFDLGISDNPLSAFDEIVKERTEAMKAQGKTPVSSTKVAELEKALADKQKAFDDYVAKVEEQKVKDSLDEIVKPKYKPVTKEKYGSKNKVVTRDAYLRAKASLREKFAQQTSGINPTIIKELSEVGAYHLEAGTREFATWSKRVLEDVGEWAEPHLEDVYKQVTGTEKKNTADTFAKRITKAVEEGKDTPEIGGFVQKLARQLVEEGINDRDVLVREVHNILKEVIPEITPRETADAISGYGKYKQLSKDDISIQVRDLKGQLQQVSKLDDLQRKGTAEKTGVERRIPSDEERRLIKLVDEAKKEYGIETIDSETQLRTKQDALKKRLVNEIKDLSDKFKNMDFAKKESIKIIPDADALKLKAERDIAKKILKAAQDASVAPTKEQMGRLIELSKTSSALKQKFNSQTEQWESPKSKADYGAAKVVIEKYISNLKSGDLSLLEMLKQRFRQAKTTWQDNKVKTVTDLTKDTLTEISDMSISFVASIDNSFLGRQGLNTLLTHPTIWASAAKKSFADIYNTMASKHGGAAAKDALMADVYSRPNYMNGSYDTAKLIPKTEEQFPTSIPERLPFGAGRIFKASENAFVNTAIRMRINTFDLMQDMARKNGVDVADKVQIQEIGKLINSVTARGDLGRIGDGGLIRLVLWAPKMLKGNWDVLTAHTAGAGLQTTFARQQARVNLLKIVASTASVVAVANAIKPGCVEIDPRSSDFLKIKVGNTRYDISGGKGSIITLLARAITFSTKSTMTGKVTPLNSGKYGAKTVFDVGIDFLVNKTTPGARTTINVTKGRDFQGKKPTIGSAAYGLTTPISIQNFVQNFYGPDADGSVSAVVGSVVDLFGINANTYQKRKKY